MPPSKEEGEPHSRFAICLILANTGMEGGEGTIPRRIVYTCVVPGSLCLRGMSFGRPIKNEQRKLSNKLAMVIYRTMLPTL